ncbi:MAG: EFR1 family ferrodoxin [Bacteroidales bacterium]|nr:EFR1 family ferrodoxin [Bacteroidales bacterium]
MAKNNYLCILKWFMNISEILPVCFSPTGHTKNVVCEISQHLSVLLQVPLLECFDFTLPVLRQKYQMISLSSTTLVVFGCPTYAGRIPNKILPFIQTIFRGNLCPTISVVTFGNRNFDSSLTELSELLLQRKFQVFAASAWVCPHVFSATIAANRPNADDMLLKKQFVDAIYTKLNKAKDCSELLPPVISNHEEIKPYYTPLDINGHPAVFLKAKPVTNTEKCTKCNICADSCPMGSVSRDNPMDVQGVCIKCHACIAKCPQHAKCFEDKNFLSHVSMLEQYYSAPAKSEIYL